MRFPALLLLAAASLAAQTAQVASGGFSAEAAARDLVARQGTQPVISFRALLQPEFDAFRKDLDKDMLPCSWEQSLRVMSLAGPYLGIRRDSYYYCKDAARPGVGREHATYDLAHGARRIALTALFPESAVVDALARDGILAKYLKVRPANLAALLKALPEDGVQTDGAGCVFLLPPKFDDFTIHHVEQGRVAVRITLQPVPEPCRGLHPELGILLPMPQSLAGQTIVVPPVRQPVQARLAFEAR